MDEITLLTHIFNYSPFMRWKVKIQKQGLKKLPKKMKTRGTLELNEETIIMRGEKEEAGRYEAAKQLKSRASMVAASDP
jgi:hypothetical protein